ncbi:MAG: hypothetical protein ACXVLX_04945 [Ilumatobacteraceae bacterium]
MKRGRLAMLGRKDYTKEEFDHARAAVATQLASYAKVAKLGGKASALDEFETVFFNNMVIVLDRYFVHRIRPVTGKDGNALNEVELIVEALMNNEGVFQGNKVIKYVPESSVLKLRAGDAIKLTAADFERLSDAFFDELKLKFL